MKELCSGRSGGAMSQLFGVKVLPSFFVLAQLYLQLLEMILEELLAAKAAKDQAVRKEMDMVEMEVVVGIDIGMSAVAAAAVVVESSFGYMLGFQTLDDRFLVVVSRMEPSVSQWYCCQGRATADC